MNTFRLQLLVLFLVFIASSSFAGVVVEDNDGSITYYDSGKMKNIHGDSDAWIFDVNKNSITIIDNEEKSYTTGTIEELCSTIKAATEKGLAEMSEQDRQAYAAWEAFMSQDKDKAPPEVRIEKKGRGEKIAGYATTVYTVYKDGEQYEELHLTDDAPVLDEIDPAKMNRLTDRFWECNMSMIGLSGGKEVEDDAAYQKLMNKHFPMKSVETHPGIMKSTDLVVRMGKQSIPAAEFAPPKGYRKMEFIPFMEQSNNKAAKDSSKVESDSGFSEDEEDMAAMREEEPFMEKEVAVEETSVSSPDQPEEEPRSLEKEIGGQIKKGLKSIFSKF